jgi:hypothetical protein
MAGYSTLRAAAIGGLRFIAISALIWVVCYNLWGFAHHPGAVPPPGTTDEIVVRNNQFQPIEAALIGAGYRSGLIDYVSARTLRGEPQTTEDDARWAKYRFAAIPLNLVRDVPDAPYVLGDFTEDGKIPPTPQELIIVANPGNGLVLYKRQPKP